MFAWSAYIIYTIIIMYVCQYEDTSIHIDAQGLSFLINLPICYVNRKQWPFPNYYNLNSHNRLPLQFCLLFQWGLHSRFYFISIPCFSCQKNIEWKTLWHNIEHVNLKIQNTSPRKEKGLLQYHCCYCSHIFIPIVINIFVASLRKWI